MELCKNCYDSITSNFCANCGQKKYKRINRKYITDEIQYSVLHLNKGFFYTLKNLLLNPGKTAREFVDGNRVNHYKPLLMAFVLAGFSAFVAHKFVPMESIMEHQMQQMQEINANNEKSVEMSKKTMSFFMSYFSIIMVTLIPIFSVLTWLSFKKWGHNYFEHIVMNAFFQSFYTATMLMLYPIYIIFPDNPSAITTIMSLAYLAIPLMLFWFFSQFYREYTKGEVVVNLLKFIGFGIALAVIVIIVAVIIAIVVAIITR